jgi:protein MAK11
MVAKRKRDTADQAGTAPAVKSRRTPAQEKKEAKAATATATAPAADLTTTTTTPKKKQPTTIKTDQSKRTGDKAHGIPSADAESTPWTSETTTVQIITGSYERVLHGFTAAIPSALVTGPDSDDAAQPNLKDDAADQVAFADTFLFNAHASSIRCLALSPPPDDPNGRILLATGSTDERINVYALSLCPPVVSKNTPKLPSLHRTTIAENSRNKELGSLLHHRSSITALHFPLRSKLLSAAEDSAIAITRTRDWEPLSTIKAPIPIPQGRPSGDTAAPGEVPSGINDFAVHPSMRLMLSVGKGEKCMRLWNLVTGKKAGVLSFSRVLLSAVGEGRFASGEGRRVVWDPEGEEFAVTFERGAVVFGIDCKPKAHIIPTPRTKIHQMHYLPTKDATVLALSTEDGRIIFYDTSVISDTKPQTSNGKEEAVAMPCALIAQLGGPAVGILGRVKDFEIIPIPNAGYLIIAGSSDGSVRLWFLSSSEIKAQPAKSENGAEKAESGFSAKQVGKLIGSYSTGARITCLKAFVMTGRAEEAADEEDGVKDEGSSSSGDEESE